MHTCTHVHTHSHMHSSTHLHTCTHMHTCTHKTSTHISSFFRHLTPILRRKRLQQSSVPRSTFYAAEQLQPSEFVRILKLLRMWTRCAQDAVVAKVSLDGLDKAAEAEADQMTEQLLAEDLEEKKAKGAAKSATSGKSKKPRRKRGGSGVASEAWRQWRTIPVASSPAALEPVAPFTETRATMPMPVAIGLIGATPTSEKTPDQASSVGVHRGRGGRGSRGLCGHGSSGRGGQRVQSATATGDGAVGAVAHLLGQASLQVPAGSSDAGVAAPVSAAAPVALGMPPPPPATVTSLADAQFSTGRQEAPESTIGGQSTCIVCFTNPKSHVAVPCGHQCACGACSALMQDCPVCRSPAREWIHVRVA